MQVCRYPDCSFNYFQIICRENGFSIWSEIFLNIFCLCLLESCVLWNYVNLNSYRRLSAETDCESTSSTSLVSVLLKNARQKCRSALMDNPDFGMLERQMVKTIVTSEALAFCFIWSCLWNSDAFNSVLCWYFQFSIKEGIPSGNSQCCNINLSCLGIFNLMC